MNKVSIFIFRGDLRLQDNTALSTITQNRVLPIFVFTPEQITNNKYKSDNAVQFMVSRLIELSAEISKLGGKLYFFYGTHREILQKIFKLLKNDKTNIIESVVYNSFVSKYSENRDFAIQDICNKHEIIWEQIIGDYSLLDNNLLNEKVYKKFTPFYKKYTSQGYKTKPIRNYKIRFAKVDKLNLYSIKNNYLVNNKNNTKIKLFNINQNIFINDSREVTLKRIKKYKKKDYNNNKNDLFVKTTVLSPYLKFGVISVREVYKYLGDIEGIKRSLYWREFYHNIHRVYSIEQLRYKNIKWLGSTANFKKWCSGDTGYPIIDANMRMLNLTGYISNRGRLIVSSFLVKTLLVNWKLGEWYFATKLIDYDIANNNGNWQWVAGTGTDVQPYFRIFNPWLQSKKYDPQASFIKHYLPELSSISAKHLHEWFKYYKEHKNIKYPTPIVDYSEQKVLGLDMYKKSTTQQNFTK